jgi:hypothetical protein
MKSKARLFAFDDVPTATKEVAAELTLESWHELAEAPVMPARDFDDTYMEDADGRQRHR